MPAGPDGDDRRLPPHVAALAEQGLLAPPILVLGDAEVAQQLRRRGLDAHAGGSRPDLAWLSGTYATILDLGWLARLSDVRRRAALRQLAAAVATGGTLHVLAERGPGALRGLGRKAWTLLMAQDARGNHWLVTFVHTAPPPAPRRMVRHFTDLGAFGSLDLGSST